MGTQEVSSDLPPREIMDVAEVIGLSKTLLIQRKIPDKQLEFIGGKDVNGAILVAIVLVTLILSIIFPPGFLVFFIVLILAVVSYATAQSNILSLDITETPEKKSLVKMTATEGKKADSFINEFIPKIRIRRRDNDSYVPQDESAQNQASDGN